MKKILLFIVLATIACSSFGDPVGSLTLDQLKSLSPDKRNEFWATVHQQILASNVAEIDGENILVDLTFSHENLTNTPELRLVAHEDGTEYIIWWVDTGGNAANEVQCEIGGKNDVVGLCFKCVSALLFYEIDVKKALQSAKAENNKVIQSAWIMDDPLLNNNDNRQMLMLYKLLETKDYSTSINNLDLRCNNNKWIFSGVIYGLKTPAAKVFYQYPVGGTGLTFLKKEVLTQEAEYNPANEIRWRIALGAVFLLVAVPTFFVVRKIGRQKTATATKP